MLDYFKIPFNRSLNVDDILVAWKKACIEDFEGSRFEDFKRQGVGSARIFMQVFLDSGAYDVSISSRDILGRIDITMTVMDSCIYGATGQMTCFKLSENQFSQFNYYFFRNYNNKK